MFWLCWVSIAAWAFSSCSEWGLLSSCNVQVTLVAMFRLLIVVASLAVECEL